MKIKCNDKVVREFNTCEIQSGMYRGQLIESRCKSCEEEFGVHDLHILKPLWKKHVCKVTKKSFEGEKQ